MAIDKVDELKAPRTFEVMQRQDFDDASQRLLLGFDEAEAVTKSLAAEGMLEATRGMESGTGARLGAYRRAAQEMLPQFAQQNMMRGQTELDLIAQRGQMGDLSSDRMLKMTTYEDLIQKMWDEGKDAERIGDMLMAYYNNEPDPVIQQYLLDRSRGYGGQIAGFKKDQAAEQKKATQAQNLAKTQAAFEEYKMANPEKIQDGEGA